MTNAFTYLPPDVCGDVSLPAFPQGQDCTDYEQLISQVCGLIALPFGVDPASSWQSVSGWGSDVDNTDTTNQKAKYLVGIGSFLPLDSGQISLAGGRLQRNEQRTQRLILQVFNFDAGVKNFGRRLQRNQKNFSCFIETVDGRMIGGASGIKPFYVDADFEWAEQGVEKMTIKLDFAFLNLPPTS